MFRLFAISLFLAFTACSEAPSWTVQVNPVLGDVKQADVVVVRSPAVLAMLAEISPAQWFKERAQIRALWGDQLEINSFKLTPGSKPLVVSYQDGTIRTVMIFEKTETSITRREAARL